MFRPHTANILQIHSLIHDDVRPGARLEWSGGKFDRLYITIGKGPTQEFSDGKWTLSDGDVTFVSRSVAYADAFPPDAEGYAIVAFLVTDIPDGKRANFSLPDKREMMRLWLRLIGDYTHKRGGWYFSCMSTLYSILALLERSAITEYFSSSSVAAVAPAIEYIEGHLADPTLSVPDVAAACGISYSHFRRLFFSLTGMSAKAYILNMRIENAKRLLAIKDLPVAAVASASGFADEYYFSAAFKKAVGLSPTSYRA